MSKSIISALGVLLCSAMLWAPSAQATTPEVTLTVDYTYEGSTIENTPVSIYLVATWDTQVFHNEAQFADLDVDFEVLKTAVSWKEEGDAVAAYVDANGCTTFANGSTNTMGFVTFNDLVPYGVYYVDVADVDYGDGTLVSSPVLITLPAYSNNYSQFTYDVVMSPKVEFVEDTEEPEIPADPEDPDPTDPEDPDNPTDPEGPEDPTTPEEPDPTDPEDPTEPDDDEPDDDAPGGSYRPKDPSDPSDPSTTSTPDDPETLDIPETPVPESPVVSIDLPFIDIIDIPVPWAALPDIPQTGTIVWLATPLGVAGLALVLFGVFGLKEKKVKP